MNKSELRRAAKEFTQTICVVNLYTCKHCGRMHELSPFMPNGFFPASMVPCLCGKRDWAFRAWVSTFEKYEKLLQASQQRKRSEAHFSRVGRGKTVFIGPDGNQIRIPDNVQSAEPLATSEVTV